MPDAKTKTAPWPQDTCDAVVGTARQTTSATPGATGASRPVVCCRKTDGSTTRCGRHGGRDAP